MEEAKIKNSLHVIVCQERTDNDLKNITQKTKD
jgi:hypothetical protein